MLEHALSSDTGHDDRADETATARAKPRTSVVLLLLAVAAVTFSYLWAYAVPDALIAAEVLPPRPDGVDPRPRHMALAFAGVMGFSLVLAMAARFMSRRHIRRIDAMSDEA